jgi:hypothetical protein
MLCLQESALVQIDSMSTFRTHGFNAFTIESKDSMSLVAAGLLQEKKIIQWKISGKKTYPMLDDNKVVVFLVLGKWVWTHCITILLRPTSLLSDQAWLPQPQLHSAYNIFPTFVSHI